MAILSLPFGEARRPRATRLRAALVPYETFPALRADASRRCAAIGLVSASTGHVRLHVPIARTES
jgi:hypothetical protein